MKARCYRQKSTSFKYYGGRGVVVCERWKHSFNNFYTDLGNAPSPNHSLDRIDNDGNYEPENVQWATPLEQTRNNRHTIKDDLFGIDIRNESKYRIRKLRNLQCVKCGMPAQSTWYCKAHLEKHRLRNQKRRELKRTSDNPV